MSKAILVDNTVVKVNDLFAWAEWFEKNGNKRIVSQDKIKGVLVSTVFLGVDYGFYTERPLWFETMIFGGTHDGFQKRYTTYDEAVEGHKEALKLVEGSK